MNLTVPILPVVIARKLAVFVRDFLFEQQSNERPVVLEEEVFGATIDTQFQFPCMFDADGDTKTRISVCVVGCAVQRIDDPLPFVRLRTIVIGF